MVTTSQVTPSSRQATNQHKDLSQEGEAYPGLQGFFNQDMGTAYQYFGGNKVEKLQSRMHTKQPV